MSLVSTYAEADDGLYYKNPVLRGDDWFICYDDDDPIEIVVAVRDGDYDAAIKKMREVTQTLVDKGMRVSIDSSHIRRGSQRCFTGDIKDKFRPAVSAFLDYSGGPVPADMITEHDGSTPKDDRGAPLNGGQACYYPAAFRKEE